MTGQSPTITLQFSRPDFASEKPWDRLISEAICRETRAEICHVDAVMPKADGSYTLIGAHIGGGIQERPADYQKWGLRIRVTIPCTQAQADGFYEYVRSMIGTPYDVKSIIGIALDDSRLHDASKMICSAFLKFAVDDKMHIVRVAKNYWETSPDFLRGCVTVVGEEVRIEG